MQTQNHLIHLKIENLRKHFLQRLTLLSHFFVQALYHLDRVFSIWSEMYFSKTFEALPFWSQKAFAYTYNRWDIWAKLVWKESWRSKYSAWSCQKINNFDRLYRDWLASSKHAGWERPWTFVWPLHLARHLKAAVAPDL